jgi:hypothetical protein
MYSKNNCLQPLVERARDSLQVSFDFFSVNKNGMKRELISSPTATNIKAQGEVSEASGTLGMG